MDVTILCKMTKRELSPLLRDIPVYTQIQISHFYGENDTDEAVGLAERRDIVNPETSRSRPIWNKQFFRCFLPLSWKWHIIKIN